MSPTKPCSTSPIKTPLKLFELPHKVLLLKPYQHLLKRGLGLCQTLNPQNLLERNSPMVDPPSSRRCSRTSGFPREGVADVNLLLGSC